jgi:hypothetical protein
VDHRIFDRGQGIVVDHVASDAGNEQIAKALVEDRLGSHATVRTGQYRREEVLAAGDREAPMPVLAGMFRSVGDETRIAGCQPGQGDIRRDRRVSAGARGMG